MKTMSFACYKLPYRIKCRSLKNYLVGVLSGLVLAWFLNPIFQELSRRRQVPIITTKDSLAQLSHLHPIAPDEFYEKVRILCWITTGPATHQTKAIHVKNTWGRRCNQLVFMSSTEDPTLPTIVLPNVTEGRKFLWLKTKKALDYIYTHYFEEADWFLKADDDSYVILENLRDFLKDYNPEQRITFGLRFKRLLQQEYLDGGAGYILSKETLRHLNVVGFGSEKNGPCAKDVIGIGEDVQLGKCLEIIGASPLDSRDSEGRHRFMKYSPEQNIFPDPKVNWYWNALYYPQKAGMDCCSDSAISFHYIPPKQMYVMEYLIYHLKPKGTRSNDSIPFKIGTTNNASDIPLIPSETSEQK